MKLSRQERRLYEALCEAKGDLSIELLHVALYDPIDDTRRMQQRIGPVISRINEKLAASKRKSERKMRIVTGEARRTYRLSNIARTE